MQFSLTVPTLEDKVLQRAVVMLLEPIYEQDFLDCSYGFRPGRSASTFASFRLLKQRDLGSFPTDKVIGVTQPLWLT